MKHFFLAVCSTVIGVIILACTPWKMQRYHPAKKIISTAASCDGFVNVPAEFDPQKDQKFAPVFTDSLPETYSFEIRDRWGVALYSTRLLSHGWNGRMNNKGNPVGNGQYMWILTFKMNNEKDERSCTGFVNCSNMTNALPVQAMDTLDCDTVLYVPNAFTPNGDGTNDTFLPQFGCPPVHYEMWIFDRWGNMIFDTKDVTKGWDGTTGKGVICQMDTYVWKVKYAYFDGDKIHQHVGKVAFLR